MKKKMLAILLALTVLLLTACAGASQPKPAPTAQSAAPAVETPSAAQTPAEARPAPAATDAPAAQAKRVEAATVEELLKAIAPNTQIVLTGRSYDLSGALGYGNFSGDWYDWAECYADGWELTVRNVNGLSIVAEKPGVEIVTAPRYANVIRFDGCKDLTLSGFTAGHSEGPGFCTGAVLHFDECERVRVENCELYGCGTYGLELERCTDLVCADSVIRNCSYGATSVTNSTGIVIEGCSVYEIENCYNGAFWFSGCSGCIVRDNLVRNCSGACLIAANYSTVGLLGCEVTRNNFVGMFNSSFYPITVAGCAFRENSTNNGWYYEPWNASERVTGTDGQTWTETELWDMELSHDVVWVPQAAQEPLPEGPIAPSEDGMIHVTTVDELLASIAPNVTIYLEDGVYDLSKATGFGSVAGKYYYWMDCYDGPGLVVTGADNLTITAGGAHRAAINAVPRYSEVIYFENCTGVTLSKFTAGHTQEPGDCAGGVLCFQNCVEATVEDCSLYGCGVFGVTAYNSRDLAVRYTEIHDCSYGAFYLSGCDGVTVERCNIHDIPNCTYQLYDCRNATADGKPLPEGSSW